MDNHYDQLFSELDTLEQNVIPTELEELYQRARDYETLLEEAAAEGQEGIQLDDLIKQCVADLDARCPFNNQEVRVTGQIQRSFYDEVSREYVASDVPADGETMISRGFYVVATDTDGSYSYTVGLYFDLPDSVERHYDATIPFADVLTSHCAFAPAGSIDIEYERTPEEKLRLLEASIPDVLAEFDSIVLNAKDECEALRLLRRMRFDMNADLPSETSRYLLGYARDCLEFDMEVPYVFEVQGLMKVEDDHHEAPADDEPIDYMYIRDEPMKIVGYVTGFMIDTVIDLKDGASVESDTQQWHAIVQVLPETRDDEQASVSVPVRAIRSMSSLRRAAYGIE